MVKRINVINFGIVGIFFILTLTIIFGWLYVKSIINSLNTSIMLDGIADNINSYVKNNSELPPNLESVGYKSDGNIILEYYREPKDFHGILKVVALTNKPASIFDKTRYGLVMEDGQVCTQDITPYIKPLGPSTEPIVIRDLIQNAVPEAGSHLLEWFDYEINKSGKRDRSHLEWIIKGIGLYRIKEGIEPLKSLYLKDGTYSSMVLRAIVKIDDPSQVPYLLECLRNETLEWSVRCEIAGFLIFHGEDEGREFLLKEYEVYLNNMSTKSSYDQTPRDVLTRIYDAKLIEDIKELLNKDYIGAPRNNITTLITRMEINTWDIEKLLDMVQERDASKSAYKRYPAIYCLGEKAGLDVIPILNDITQNDAARNAVKEIKYRHWKDLIQN